MELRKDVRIFAEEMEYELRRHDPKKGDSWKDMSPFELIFLLDKEYLELDREWIAGDKKRMREELIDLANIAMMVWHRLGE